MMVKLSLAFVDNGTCVISYFMKVMLLTYPFSYGEYPFQEGTVRDCIDRVCSIKCQCSYELLKASVLKSDYKNKLLLFVLTF